MPALRRMGAGAPRRLGGAMNPSDLNVLDLTARLGLPMEATPAQIAARIRALPR